MTQSVRKVWNLLGQITAHDIETIQRAGVEVTVYRDDYESVWSSTRQYISDRTEVNITTVNDKEEAWLKLCFGERLYHFSTQYNFDVAKY